MKLLLHFALILGLSLILASNGHAHESRPFFLEITETQTGIFEVQYKTPSSIPDFNLPSVSLPGHFKALDQLTMYKTMDGFIKQQKFRSANGLNRATITIKYPVLNPSVSTIVRISLLNGQVFNQLLSPKELEWTVPEEESTYGVAKQYTVLGIQHILEGWDHLLFLVCLILVAGTGRKMLITITGFTLAHSVTLVMSTLNVVNLPIPPVEAVIALSVVFLASEIVINNRRSLTYEYPIAVSSSFGLLHGFGFASVLSDIGLPQTVVPASLLFFNVGVEIGQIIFLVAVIVLFKSAEWVKEKYLQEGLLGMTGRQLEQGTAYIAGSVASFWMIERVLGF